MSDAASRAGAILTIDLDAIAGNWRTLANRVRPARCAAVVKADAYGLGAAQVVPALAAAGCTRFFVATLDEGIVARAAAPDAEVVVLSGPYAGTEGEFTAQRLIPALNSPEQVAAWRAHAGRKGAPLPSAVQIDTGLSRLGLSAAEAGRLAADKDTLAAIAPLLVMSHLACAEIPHHPLNALQRDRFTKVRALFPGTPASLAASSGIVLGGEWHLDWVRPGAALWGINPGVSGSNSLAQTVELKGRIVQVRDIDAGETVGYGATWRAPAKTRLAVVAAGYADGLLRSLSNKGSAMLGEARVPLVGRVSMDLMVFDVGALPEGAARAGEFVTLIGAGNTVDQVGTAAGSNAYEILTGLGRRYHRVWRGSGAAGNETGRA